MKKIKNGITRLLISHTGLSKILDITPDIHYARLPTTKSNPEYSKDLDRYLNKEVFDNVLKNEPSSSKTLKINDALLFSGRDGENYHVDSKFKSENEHIKGVLQTDKSVSIDEYALDLDWQYNKRTGKYSLAGKSVISTYNLDDLETADLIYLGGHGSTNSISIIKKDSLIVYSVDKTLPENMDQKGQCGEKLKFYYDLIPQRYDFSYCIKDGFSHRLSLPVVFAASCLTADRAEEWSKVPLSETFMHFNAGSYAGWGTSTYVNVADILTRAYFDQVVVEQDLGYIFHLSMIAASKKIKQNYSGQLEADYLRNLDYFIQLGYPKWNIDPNEDAPDYSNPLLPTSIDFHVTDYNISTLYNTTTINFNGTLDGNIVSSTDWMLQGNPIIPYIHLVYDLPEGKTIGSLTFNTGYKSFLGQYNLTMLPGSYFGPRYEYYPLNLTAYMEHPVEWKIFENTDGNMSAVIDIFPFQYYPDNGTVIFYNNFSISTSERERTASIDSVSTDKRLYVKGDIAEITVNCTGSALINVTVDGFGSMTQQSTGSNVFTVDTSELTAGSPHDVDIKLYDCNSLIDEMLTCISVVDSLITMSLETSDNSTAMGSPLNLSILVTNLGGSATVVSPDLVVDTENVSRISLGDLTLSAHESKFVNTTIATSEMPFGMVLFYAEADMGTITVNSNYEAMTIYEDVSDFIIVYEIEPEVIHLTFSSPYVDNVHYSLDNGFNTSLHEPYDIDISNLTEGSHNITVYADDVFGNEKSICFQFVRHASGGFDTLQSESQYPSISGTHTGTIIPNQDVNVSKVYTYPCAGTGGHTESVRIYGNGTDESASWNGYAEDWHTLTFDSPFTLESGKTYNYVIKTGSYPQIHHTKELQTDYGWLNCTKFTDANGKEYDDWIPAIRLGT